MAEKGTEDIVGRLEALRKRVPTDKAPEDDKKPEPAEGEEEPSIDDKRKKIARIVGVVVIVLILLVGIVAVNKFVIQPKKVSTQAGDVQLAQAQAEVNKGKQDVSNFINDYFSGLPDEYKGDKTLLQEEVSAATTIPQLLSILERSKGKANDAWRLYRADGLTELAQKTDKIRMLVTVGTGNTTTYDTYKGESKIRNMINRLDYETLKTVEIEEVGITYVAIQLDRLQAVGGLAEIGKRVNVYFKDAGDMVNLAGDAKVMATMRGSATIAVSESETKAESGGGVEGTGSLDSFGIGSTSATLDGNFQGSSGSKTMASSTIYATDLLEIQKAAAAGKLNQEYIDAVLKQYGEKLGELERESNLAEFDEEYILLLEVTEEEAPDILLRMTEDDDRENIYVALSEPTSWMNGI